MQMASASANKMLKRTRGKLRAGFAGLVSCPRRLANRYDLCASMKTRTFFYASLALPLVMAVVLLPLMFFNEIFFFPALALWFGGIPYLAFAFLMCFAIARIQTLSKLLKLVLLSPVIYLVFLNVFLIANGYFRAGQLPSVESVIVPVQVFSAFALILGYIYVALFFVAYTLAPLKDIDDYNPDHNNGFNADAGKTGAG
jgi:hypothetical protein